MERRGTSLLLQLRCHTQHEKRSCCLLPGLPTGRPINRKERLYVHGFTTSHCTCCHHVQLHIGQVTLAPASWCPPGKTDPAAHRLQCQWQPVSPGLPRCWW